MDNQDQLFRIADEEKCIQFINVSFYIERQRLLKANVSILMAKRYRFGKITALEYLYKHYNPDIMTCNKRELFRFKTIFLFNTV